MKILIGTDLFYQNIAGSVNFIRQLASGLIKDGHQVFVIAPSKKFKNTLTKENDITVYGIRSVIIPDVIYPSQFRIPVTVGSMKIRSIIEEINPHVINIQDHFMIGGKVAKEGKRLGIPLVGTNHFMPENFIHYIYPLKFARKPISKLAWRQFINVYKNLNLITTPTKTAAQLIINIGLKNPIIPISNGVDLEKFNPKKNSNFLKKRFGISNSDQIVLSVGRLDKEKHTEVIIKAFSHLPKKIHAKLVITGKGKERSKLIKLAKKLRIYNRIIFTGFIPDEELPFVYSSADLFAIASIAELQSIATMEAMASGLPVVAANVMALPELVHHGDNGYLFEREDFKTLANQISKILTSPTLKKKMSENSLKIIKRHNFNNTIKKYEAVYKLVCKL